MLKFGTKLYSNRGQVREFHSVDAEHNWGGLVPMPAAEAEVSWLSRSGSPGSTSVVVGHSKRTFQIVAGAPAPLESHFCDLL